MKIIDYFKAPISKEYLDLSIGRVYFREITNGIVNKVTSRATIANNVINNNLYFQLMEYGLVDLSRRKLDNLPLRDANLIREKVKQILLRNNLVKEEVATPSDNVFSKKDVDWFNKTKTDSINRIRGQNGRA